MSQSLEENDAAGHLMALGYVDPIEIATEEAQMRARHEAKLRAVLEVWKQGRGEDAAALLQQLIQDDPTWIAPRRWLAEICYRIGRLNDAQRQLDWLTWHGVESPQLAILAGGIALARRDIRGAVDLLAYAGYVEPKLPQVHVLLGSALVRLQQLDEAEKSFRAALSHNNSDTRALDGMAAVCLLRGEYEEAAEWALGALAQDMQLFRAHYNLGVALAHLRRPVDAVRALEMAAHVEPSHIAPYYWLQRIAEKQLMDAAKGAAYRDRGRELVKLRRRRRSAARNSSSNAK